VFFDIEATGVPHMEKGGKTKITEISLIAVSRDEFYKEYKGLPRVLPKLTILSNPERKISYITSRLTGQGLTERSDTCRSVSRMIFRTVAQSLRICCHRHTSEDDKFDDLLATVTIRS
jgi:pyoverdine/dityrosine biosynthesis protein Dit1